MIHSTTITPGNIESILLARPKWHYWIPDGIDSGIIGYFKAKAGKRGYQTLINGTLKKVISSEITESGSLEKTLRKIIREELSVAGNSQ